MKIPIRSKWITLAISFCLPMIAKGQPDWLKCRKEAISLNSGFHDGVKGSAPNLPAFRGTVQISNAPWLKIYFGNCELGQNSYLKMTSLEDGGYQNLNAISLKQWSNTSAYFNGDAVEVELYVEPEDRGIFFEIKEVVVGERFGGLSKSGKSSQIASDPCDPNWCGIIGTTDDRVPYNDSAVGRLSGIRSASGDSGTIGTAWIASNGAYVTAGHNFFDDPGANLSEFFEFNVPASDPNGDPNFAHPDNQYAIDLNSIVGEYVQVGRDWAIYKCFPNSNTGLLPVQVQNAFYRLSLDSAPPTFRVTGYGVDECPYGTDPPPGGNGRNSSSNTRQTHTGPNSNAPSYGDIGSGSVVYWIYDVDIRIGNSGSPMIPEGTGLSVGIQSHCTTGGPNYATSFDCNALEDSINVFPGANIRYADNGHPFATGAGTVFRPYNTVAGAVNAVPVGGIVSIVKGSYNENMTINKAMTITAPVGNVTIGPGGPPKVAGSDLDPTVENSDGGSKAMAYSLSQNYPNPFNPKTTIEYTLPRPSHVKLTIFDMLGQEVKTLVNEFQQQGAQSVVWDGKNNRDHFVPSGTYIYRVIADGFTQSFKLLMLK